MKEIFLKFKGSKTVLEAEVINPDIFAGKNLSEIENLPVYHGNRKAKLGEFFDVEGSTSEDAEKLRIVVEGKLENVKRIGEKMSGGEIVIKGNAGMHTGDFMSGGKIVVEGNVESFCATEMRGGEFIVRGNAGDYLGSAYRGNWVGMNGGLIVVEGNVGRELCTYMSGGKVIVKGNAGDFAGAHMKKGFIVIEGDARRVGAQMLGGTIVVLKNIEPLPSFEFAGEESDIEIDGEKFSGTFLKYIGDKAEPRAKGVLYIKK